MLRAVLNEVEVVLSSSSILREPAVACDHLFEFYCGGSAAAVRSVVGARRKVAREVLPDAGRGCRSAKVDRAALGFETQPSGAGSLPTPASALGLPRSWFKPEVACERSPSPKLQKQRAAQPKQVPGTCRDRTAVPSDKRGQHLLTSHLNHSTIDLTGSI
jgi:hypothetical protein